MNLVYYWPALLADHDRFSHIGEHFRRGGNDVNWMHLALLAFFCIVVAVVVWLLNRYISSRDGQPYNNPNRLFSELCAAHHLDARSRRLLRQLARLHGLAQPALIFVEPQRFAAEGRPAAMRGQAAALDRLQQKLFGG